jgi:hypothetical protein
VTKDTPGEPYISQLAADVFVKSIGTYVLPAAPPPCVVSTVTRSEDVAQVANIVPPVAVADARGDAPEDAACEPPDVPLLTLELFPDELADFGCELLDEPQPASSAVASVATATAPATGSADREIKIIKMPLRLCRKLPPQTLQTPGGTHVKTRK